MTAFTFQFVLHPATHDVAPKYVPCRERRGDIINVWPAEQQATFINPDWILNYNPIGESKLQKKIAYLHIRDVPDAITLERIRNKLTRSLDSFFNSGLGEWEYDTYRFRKRRILTSSIPAAIRNKILTEQQITLNWEQVKPYIRKRIITSKIDPSTDDESTELIDADLQ